jgi:O-antigen/teichoic acid export membrane protein
MNERKVGTILSYLHILLSNTISILYTPYMLQMMGQSEYGLYGTANSFISYLSVLSFGIGGAYIRFNTRCRVSGDREEEKRLNGMFLSVFSILACLVMVGGIICIVFAGELVKKTFTDTELLRLRIIMLILTLNMMMTFICNVITMSLQAYEKYFCIRIVTLVAGIVNPVVNIIALEMGGRSVAIALISFLISAASYLVYFIYARHAIKLQFSFKGFRKDILKEIFVFSGFLFINSLTDQLTHSTDNIVLSAIKGTGAVAIYTVGSSFKNYFQLFSSSISSVFSPKVNLMVAQGCDMRDLDDVFTRVGRVQFYLVSLILIGYLSIGADFVRLWAGEDYSDAFYIGLILMLSAFVPAFQNVGLEIQKAKNMHKARSIVYFFVALVNVALTIPFSRLWNGIGAALATLICVFMGTVVFMNYYYHKYVGLNIFGFWKSIGSILPGFLLPMAVGLLINRLWEIKSLLEILAAAVIISVTFLASVWKIGMNEYEQDLIRKPLRRLLRKEIKN